MKCWYFNCYVIYIRLETVVADMVLNWKEDNCFAILYAIFIYLNWPLCNLKINLFTLTYSYKIWWTLILYDVILRQGQGKTREAIHFAHCYKLRQQFGTLALQLVLHRFIRNSISFWNKWIKLKLNGLNHLK